jgi:hypothetical protein
MEQKLKDRDHTVFFIDPIEIFAEHVKGCAIVPDF